MDLAELLGHEAVDDGDQLLAWARARAAELVETLDPDDPLGALLTVGASPSGLDDEHDGVPVSRRRRREPSSPQPKTADELPPPPEHPGLADGEPEPVLETVDTGPIDLEEEIVRRRMREDSWALASTTRELERVIEREQAAREVPEVVEVAPVEVAPETVEVETARAEASSEAAEPSEPAVEKREASSEPAVEAEPAAATPEAMLDGAEPSIEIDVASEPSIEIDVDVDLAGETEADVEAAKVEAASVEATSPDASGEAAKVEAAPDAGQPVGESLDPRSVEGDAAPAEPPASTAETTDASERAVAPEPGDEAPAELALAEPRSEPESASAGMLETSDEPEAAQPRVVETSAPELPVVVGPAQPSELDFVEPAGLDLAAIDVPEPSSAADENDEEFEVDDLDEIEVEEVELDDLDEPEDEPAKPSAGPPGKAPPKPPPPKPPPRKDATPREDTADLVSELIRSSESKTAKLDELDGAPDEPE